MTDSIQAMGMEHDVPGPWEKTAKRYAANARYWRGEYERVLAELNRVKECRQDAPESTITPDPDTKRRDDHAAYVEPGYEILFNVLVEALDQAQHGKGRQRHNPAGDLPFLNQNICHEAIDGVGIGYTTGQARKKTLEAMNLDHDKAIQEWLGAINYLAATIIAVRFKDAK